MDDPGLPATVWLGNLISRRVERKLTAGFEMDSAGTIRLNVQPENLLKALWFQFGLAVSEQKSYRRCSLCQDWFELAPQLARTSRLFCSVACKNKMFRIRKDRARLMRSEGKSLREIATELETTIEIIKGWVNTKKG